MSSHTFDLQTVACKVYGTLTDVPASRDDDRVLIANIWMNEANGVEREDFLSLFLKGDLSNPETITRVRRKLQEQHVKLRGDKWEVRHKMEGSFCEQLTFFDKW